MKRVKPAHLPDYFKLGELNGVLQCDEILRTRARGSAHLGVFRARAYNWFARQRLIAELGLRSSGPGG